MDLKKIIKNLRKRIEDDHYEFENDWQLEHRFKYLDEFIIEEKTSDLEKAFFLILNQFYADSKDYFIIPREMVLIPDVYDVRVPGIEYEIDFALYGGSIDNPIKVAIECDGIRSHRQKHNNKDRRKDVNLQAAGWIVMRFGSSEIHDELQKFENDKTYISDFLKYVENVIQEKSKVITYNKYATLEYRSKLTGYTWGNISCIHCKNSQIGILNRKKHTCFYCGERFQRDFKFDEKVKYEQNGLLFFE